MKTPFASIAVIAVLSGCGAGTTIGSSPAPQGPSPSPSATATPAATATASAMATPSPGASATATAVSSPTPTPTASPTPTPGIVPTIRPTSTPPVTPMPSATPTAAPPPPGPIANASMYLGDIGVGAVLISSSASIGATSPDATIFGSKTGFTDSRGSSPIYGIAVDAQGTIYVLTQTLTADQTATVSEAILVFAPGTFGNVAPTRTIALPNPIDAQSLAVSGTSLYVSDDAGAGAIDVYATNAAGPAAPTRTFTDRTGFSDPPLKVSVDSTGRAFVASYDQSGTAANEALQAVYEFSSTANGATAPAATLSGANTSFAKGVLDAAVVDANGRIDAVLDDATNDTLADVDEFASGASGNQTPSTQFQDGNSDGPVDGAVDAAGNFYVTGIENNTRVAKVNVFAPGAVTPRQILAFEAQLPLVAIGPYVATTPSGSTPIATRHRPYASVRALRARRHFRRFRLPSSR